MKSVQKMTTLNTFTDRKSKSINSFIMHDVELRNWSKRKLKRPFRQTSNRWFNIQYKYLDCISSNTAAYHKRIMLICATWATFIIILATLIPVAQCVDCFKCTSRNGSNPACEDPFHNLNSTRVTTMLLTEPQPPVGYHTPCFSGKKGREGLFPASACIKLTGKLDATGESLVIRHCALDSGTLTQDTELDPPSVNKLSKARMSHCGKFQFDGDLLQGCVMACGEDACNSAETTRKLPQSGGLPIIQIVLFVFTSLIGVSTLKIH